MAENWLTLSALQVTRSSVTVSPDGALGGTGTVLGVGTVLVVVSTSRAACSWGSSAAPTGDISGSPIRFRTETSANPKLGTGRKFSRSARPNSAANRRTTRPLGMGVNMQPSLEGNTVKRTGPNQISRPIEPVGTWQQGSWLENKRYPLGKSESGDQQFHEPFKLNS